MKLEYISVVSLGNDKTYAPSTDGLDPHPIIIRDPIAFKTLINRVSTKYTPYQKEKILFVTSFNEWFEGTPIEPTNGYGSEYLKIMKESLGSF